MPLGLAAQLYVGPGDTVTVLTGTDVFFAGVEIDTSGTPGLLDVQATSLNTAECVIDGEILGDAQISFGDFTNLSIDNGTWSVLNQTDEVIEDFTMGTAAYVEVGPGLSLTTNGTFDNSNTDAAGSIRLFATSFGYGQLLTNNVSTKGVMYAEQYLTAVDNDGWRQLSSPVSTTLVEIDDDFQTYYPNGPGPIGIAGQWNVYWYDASPITPNGGNTTSSLPNGSDANAKHWTAATDNSLAFGPGDNATAFDLFVGTPFSLNLAEPGVLDVTGEFGNGDYTFDVYRTDDFVAGESGTTTSTLITGWNLIPNNYPSNIDVGTLLLDGGNFDLAYKAVHVWDGKTQQYRAMTGDVASVIEWNNTKPNALDSTNNIAPFQAFWVKAAASPSTNPTADENITLTNAHRTVEDNSNLFKTSPPLIRLRIADADEKLSDQNVIAFEAVSTLGLDNNDAFKLQSLNEDVPSIYTTVEGSPLSINRLPSPDPAYSIPLFVKSKKAGESYTIDMRDENIDPSWTIYLEDVKNGKMHNLRNGAYNFTHDATMQGNRFVVHINVMPGMIDANTWNNVSIYSNIDGINVAFANPDVSTATVLISNLAGQVLYQGTVSTGRVFTYPANDNVALYAIQVVTGKKVTHEKVVR